MLPHAGRNPRFVLSVASLAAVALLLVTAGCRYSDIGVGKSPDMTTTQAEQYAKSTYGESPAPLEERPGNGRPVQPDRMVTVDLAFSDADGNPIAGDRIRFLYPAPNTPGTPTGSSFGYVSPALLAAMAGMREGGNRRVRLTDSTCSEKYSYPYADKCKVFEAFYSLEHRTGGVILYPPATPLQVTISAVQVCRPTIEEKTTPDFMGSGAGRTLTESSCR